jgi:hypothetical protein
VLYTTRDQAYHQSSVRTVQEAVTTVIGVITNRFQHNPFVTRINLILIFTSSFLLTILTFRTGLLSGQIPSHYPTLCAPVINVMRSTCPTHLILLDLIILTIFGEENSLYAKAPH